MEHQSATAKYDVEIHFPYSYIKLYDVPKWRVKGWQANVRAGKVFEVKEGLSTYSVNPALVTYIEFHPHAPLPF